MVLVMVLPSVVMVVKRASVDTGTEEPAAPPAPKMVVLPIVLVIVLPSVVMVVRTGAVLIAELLASEPLAPPEVPEVPELPEPLAAVVAVPVTAPVWVKAWVALRVREEPDEPEAAGKE